MCNILSAYNSTMDIWDIDLLITDADRYRSIHGKRSGRSMALDEFSLHCDLSQSHYRMIRKKVRKKITEETIEKIAHAIDMNPLKYLKQEFVTKIASYAFSNRQEEESISKHKKGDGP